MSSAGTKHVVQKPDTKQLIGTALTLSNTMMGAALLSLPFTFSRLGYILAVLIAFFAFFFSYSGFEAIIDAAHFTQCKTMRGMISNIFGKTISTIIDACIAFMYCGFLVSYVSICGDYIKIFIEVVGKVTVDLRIVKACLLVVLAPLTALSSTTALSNISAFAIIFIVITVVSVVVFFFIGLAKNKGLEMQVIDSSSKQLKYGIYKYSISDLDYASLHKPTHTKAGYAFLEFIQRIPLFMPLFGCHASVPVLLHDLEGQPQYKRNLMKKAINIACITVFVLYMVNAICSYLLFGKNIAGNVLVSFTPDNYVMTAVRLCYAFVIILSFVVIVYPIRSIFMEWMGLEFTQRKGKIAFYIIGICLSIFGVGISILVPDIVTVFNAVAALFGIAVYWVIPIISRWKNPQLEAQSDVPEFDDIEQQRRDTISIRKNSLIKQYVRYNKLVDSNWYLQKTVKSRSEVLHDFKAEDIRHRSQTMQSYQVAMENVISDQKAKQEPLKQKQQQSSKDQNNSQLSVDEINRYRAKSIAEQNPARLNEQLAELAKKYELSDQQKKETPKVENDEDSIAIACAMAAIEEQKPEDLQVKEVEQPTEQKKADLMKKMTQSRKTCMIVSCVIVICINLTAFVLTTFFDMSTSRFIKYEGYPDYPKQPNIV